jgi:hypothetical protein
MKLCREEASMLAALFRPNCRVDINQAPRGFRANRGLIKHALVYEWRSYAGWSASGRQSRFRGCGIGWSRKISPGSAIA